MHSAALVREGVAQAERPERLLPAKRHICFVSPYIWPVLSRDAGIRMVGGAEVQQSVLIRLLRRDGYADVRLLCHDHRDIGNERLHRTSPPPLSRLANRMIS